MSPQDIPRLQQLGPHRRLRAARVHAVPIPSQPRTRGAGHSKFSGGYAPTLRQVYTEATFTEDSRPGRIVHVIAKGNQAVALPRPAGIDGVIQVDHCVIRLGPVGCLYLSGSALE